MKTLLVVAADEADAVAPADVIALDLAGGPIHGGRAQPALAAGISYVRIVPVEDDDSAGQLAAAMAMAPDGIVLAGAASGRDVALLDARLTVHEAERGLPQGRTRIIAVAGTTAAALFEMGSFAGASSRLAGLAFDEAALAQHLGASDTHACDLARTLVRLAARAAGVPAYRLDRRQTSPRSASDR